MESRYNKALIVPYFGKFNNYFPLWLKSCEYNSDYDWFIYTDDHTEYCYPNNVHVRYMEFESLKDKINSLFEFEISLDSPYKLCDYKPVYGELFQEDLKGYDFWGYCDTDLIWGHLSDFYTDDILEKYDKISDSGHFTLYKNNEKMRTAYRALRSEDCMNYETVYTTSDNLAFDEWGNNRGINRILINNGFKIYYKPIYFSDIRINTYGLYNTRSSYDLDERRIQESGKHKIVFLFDNGSLTQYALSPQNKLLTSQEAYIHLQKRPMKIEDSLSGKTRFIIYPPNCFKNPPEIIDTDFLQGIPEEKIYWHYYKIRWNSLKSKIRKRIKL